MHSFYKTYDQWRHFRKFWEERGQISIMLMDQKSKLFFRGRNQSCQKLAEDVFIQNKLYVVGQSVLLQEYLIIIDQLKLHKAVYTF